MVWQQWVLLIWYVLRSIMVIPAEIKKSRPDIEPEDRDRAIAVGIIAWLIVAAVLIALVVTI